MEKDLTMIGIYTKYHCRGWKRILNRIAKAMIMAGETDAKIKAYLHLTDYTVKHLRKSLEYRGVIDAWIEEPEHPQDRGRRDERVQMARKLLTEKSKGEVKELAELPAEIMDAVDGRRFEDTLVAARVDMEADGWAESMETALPVVLEKMEREDEVEYAQYDMVTAAEIMDEFRLGEI